LLKEIEVLAQKCAQHGQNVFIQGTLAPVYNVLRDLSGLHPQALPPLEHYLDNDQLILESQKADKTDQISVESKLLLTISQSVYLRDFGKAQEMAKLFEDAHDKGMPVFLKILISFYAGLTACHFGRETKDLCWLQKAWNHCKRIETALAHSVWNMENKYLLLMAEYHYTKGDVSEAAKLYEESITSAKNHRFEHEAALASELAGHFYIEQGDVTKAETVFEQARALYEKWGANKKAQALLQRHEHTK
jgi:ATP-dependent RNA helicase DDX31/DBP7